MPSTYTPGGIELIGDGEQSGSWGGTTNTNLQILDRMISQAGSITLSGTTHTLTISDGTLSDGQYGILVFGGSPSGTNTVTISPNDAQRSYIVKNDSGESVVLTQGSGGNVTVADGKTALVYCDGAGSGAAVVDLTADLAVAALTLADLGVTASASELNTLDGVTTDASSYFTASGALSNRNKIINGAMQVAQRGTNFAGGTANADDAYTLDRWYVLSEGSDSVDVDQVADSPDTGGKCIRLDVETTGEKFGVAQIVEAINCTGLIGNTVTLSFEAKVSNARIDTVKAAIVAWSGTADAVTSDIVSTWNADGTTPTLIANATFENTPADLGVTTSWAKYEITATVDTASTANLIVFIWSDDATNPLAGDFLYVTNVQLEVGDTATPFEQRSYGQELALCQRYYETGATGSASAHIVSTFRVTKRATPTMTRTGNVYTGSEAGSSILPSGGDVYYAAGASQAGGYWTADAEL